MFAWPASDLYLCKWGINHFLPPSSLRVSAIDPDIGDTSVPQNISYSLDLTNQVIGWNGSHFYNCFLFFFCEIYFRY